jgi:hypothetical protein
MPGEAATYAMSKTIRFKGIQSKAPFQKESGFLDMKAKSNQIAY